MHLLHATGARAEQLIELAEQGTQRVPGGDDLAARARSRFTCVRLPTRPMGIAACRAPLTCGAKGTRTPGLLDANQTLFQLSYSPEMSSVKGTRYYRPARITA